ncbi:MAG: M24 family metallopeptidase [Candidatus Kapaibacteriales bacterium]
MLIEAEEKAKLLFQEVENRGFIKAGKTELKLNKEVYELAAEILSIRKYWHKRIVRAGANTLLPYHENPKVLRLREDEILFFDFGPVFEDWEADIGRTYVLGEDENMKKLKADVEKAWHIGNRHYLDNKETITGAEFYSFTEGLAIEFGWEYGNEHCGHLIGNFPHENLEGEEKRNYIHPENYEPMSELGKDGNERHWIYEIHFVDKSKEIGGFFEQMLRV